MDVKLLEQEVNEEIVVAEGDYARIDDERDHNDDSFRQALFPLVLKPNRHANVLPKPSITILANPKHRFRHTRCQSLKKFACASQLHIYTMVFII